MAECDGLHYLLDSLDGTEMSGVIGTGAVMTERLTLRYPVATAPEPAGRLPRGRQHGR